MTLATVWKPVIGCPGYMASVYGEILSLKNRKPLVLQQPRDSHGYCLVNMPTRNRVFVHRLVAAAWLDLDLNDVEKVVMHIDDDPSNNHLYNLRVGTQQDNIADMRSKGRHARGDAVAKKLTQAKVDQIRLRLSLGERGKHLAAEYGVTTGLISAIKNNHRWAA